MPSSRALPAASCAAVLLALLTGCSGQPAAGSASAASGGGTSAAPSSTGGGAAAVDACGLATTEELRAATGADPGKGVAAAGRIDGGQCTWEISETRAVLLQYTRSAKQFLPAEIYPKPEDGVAVDGVDTGWASAEKRTVYLVKGDEGVLLTDIGFGGGEHGDYAELGKAIAARL